MPDDIAHLCGTFLWLQTSRLSMVDLQRAVLGSARLDARASADEIMMTSVEMGLLLPSADAYVLTKLGREVGKAQGHGMPSLMPAAQDVLAKKVYTNHAFEGKRVGRFFLRFKPDVARETLVYARPADEPTDDLRLLLQLQRVQLVNVDDQIVMVNPVYLPQVNELLAKMRDPDFIPGVDDEHLLEIGDIAERYAVEYEKRRLARNGYSELVPFVQRISLIDQTAGYDVVSFEGRGSVPEAEIYIEVKGTTCPNVRFYWSRNEMRVAQEQGKRYWVYCYTRVNVEGETARGPVRIENAYARVRPPEFAVKPLKVYAEMCASS